MTTCGASSGNRVSASWRRGPGSRASRSQRCRAGALLVGEHAEVPLEIVTELRSVCLGMAEAYEEQAWVSTRWMVRKKNFTHVLMVDSGWPPAYARAAG